MLVQTQVFKMRTMPFGGGCKKISKQLFLKVWVSGISLASKEMRARASLAKLFQLIIPGYLEEWNILRFKRKIVIIPVPRLEIPTFPSYLTLYIHCLFTSVCHVIVLITLPSDSRNSLDTD